MQLDVLSSPPLIPMTKPLTPHWVQPSHPLIQKVIHSSSSTSTNTPAEFTTTSVSTIALPPFGFYAELTFPPCTISKTGATYATVQMGRNEHLELNSDLLYVEHSCKPSLIFNTTTMKVTAGPNGLKEGEELSFFYPSTEWNMAQGFQCRCGQSACRGWIDGAKNMTRAALEKDGMWLSDHIKEMLAEQEAAKNEDATEKGKKSVNGVRGGVSSRELSGEMGGDTIGA